MKLKLRIEELAVDSFQAAPATAQGRGTVRAHASDPNTCYPMICYSGHWTCIDSCQDTCGLSCNGTCIPAYCNPES
jgi:hypothetical protein